MNYTVTARRFNGGTCIEARGFNGPQSVGGVDFGPGPLTDERLIAGGAPLFNEMQRLNGNWTLARNDDPAFLAFVAEMRAAYEAMS